MLINFPAEASIASEKKFHLKTPLHTSFQILFFCKLSSCKSCVSENLWHAHTEQLCKSSKDTFWLLDEPH